jgi:hypothetical protein
VPTYDGNVLTLATLADGNLVIGGHFSKLWSGHFQARAQNVIVLFDTDAPPERANRLPGTCERRV